MRQAIRDSSSGDGKEADQMPGVAEGDVKALKEIFSADQIEAYPKARRKADGSLKLNGSDLDSQTMRIDRNLASIPYRDQSFGRSAAQRNTETLGVGFAKDAETCSRIDIRARNEITESFSGLLSRENNPISVSLVSFQALTPYLAPSERPFDLNGDKRGREFSVKETVLEDYRAQHYCPVV